MKTIYFKKLDALRFLAFFFVFWQHGFANSFKSVTLINRNILDQLTFTGGIGVHVFFVISGFLISFLLLKEHEKKGSISIKNFYIRRILRIWPLYYLVLIAGIFILPRLINTFVFCGNPYLNLLFLNNFDMNMPCDAQNVGIAWSIAIEEQFYLIWPVIFFLFANAKRYLYIICFTIYLLSSFFILKDPATAYFHTLGNLNYLMVGCIGALAFTKYNRYITDVLQKKHLLYLVITVLALLTIFTPTGSHFLLPFLYLYLVLFTVASANDSEKGSLFSYLGKYTYGMYIYHPIIIIVAKIVFDLLALNYQTNAIANTMMATIALLLTIGLSIASYELFEKRILKFKSRFSQINTRI